MKTSNTRTVILLSVKESLHFILLLMPVTLAKEGISMEITKFSPSKVEISCRLDHDMNMTDVYFEVHKAEYSCLYRTSEYCREATTNNCKIDCLANEDTNTLSFLVKLDRKCDEVIPIRCKISNIHADGTSQDWEESIRLVAESDPPLISINDGLPVVASCNDVQIVCTVTRVCHKTELDISGKASIKHGGTTNTKEGNRYTAIATSHAKFNEAGNHTIFCKEKEKEDLYSGNYTLVVHPSKNVTCPVDDNVSESQDYFNPLSTGLIAPLGIFFLSTIVLGLFLCWSRRRRRVPVGGTPIDVSSSSTATSEERAILIPPATPERTGDETAPPNISQQEFDSGRARTGDETAPPKISQQEFDSGRARTGAETGGARKLQQDMDPGRESVNVSGPAVGIDLGTTNSCVGIVKRTMAEIIPNSQGKRTTPSCVAFIDEECLVGELAKDQLVRNQKNTIYEVKRLIGRDFNDVEDDLKHFPFEVIKDENSNDITIKVEKNGKTEKITPEYVSSIILRHLKEQAENSLNDEVTSKAIVAVPAYFTPKQCEATMKAARLAGFTKYDYVKEPVAAAFAYRLNEELQEKNILVYDLGGGTFNVSIVHSRTGEIDMKKTDGITSLGGMDFDRKLVDYALQKTKEKYEEDLFPDYEARGRLKQASEKAKVNLSYRKKAAIEMEYKGQSYSIDISRALFEEMCQDLFDETLKITERCLEKNGFGKDDIHQVLLVGGSTRIPRIQQMLKEFFGEEKLKVKVNVDEVVAIGAAYRAAMKYGGRLEKVDHVVLLDSKPDVIPLSLGTQLKGGLMDILIASNTTIPHVYRKHYYTERNYQKEIVIDVFEGERELVKDNKYLGEFSIEVSPRGKGKNSVMVEFRVVNSGKLEVTAKDESEKIFDATFEIQGCLSRETEKIIEDAKRYKAQDQAQREVIEARNKLEMVAAREKLRYKQMDISEKDKENATARCEEAIEWSLKNTNANKKQIHDQLTELINYLNLVK